MAHARTNVILAGKCGSHRQSTKGFSENIVEAKTSYPVLEISSIKGNKGASFVGEKSTMKFSVVSTLENRRENRKLNVFLVAVLVLESKG